jgi:hypothetical protein
VEGLALHERPGEEVELLAVLERRLPSGKQVRVVGRVAFGRAFKLLRCANLEVIFRLRPSHCACRFCLGISDMERDKIGLAWQALRGASSQLGLASHQPFHNMLPTPSQRAWRRVASERRLKEIIVEKRES